MIVLIRNLSGEPILDILESGPLGRQELMHICLTCKCLRCIAVTRLYEKIDISGDLKDRRVHHLLLSILQNNLLNWRDG